MMKAFIHGIGVLGPGLIDWLSSIPILRGEHPFDPTQLPHPSPAFLPPNERRRSSEVVKWSLEAAFQAVQASQVDPKLLPVVFASSGGETGILHNICLSLTNSPPVVSPTLFHQSVHNAAAGYWSIAWGSQKSATSLSCYDASFVGGLLEAMTCLTIGWEDRVLLVSYDIAAPLPLYEARPLTGSFAVGMVLGRQPIGSHSTALEIAPPSASTEASSSMDNKELESLRVGNPAGRSLPLLQAIAKGGATTVVLNFLDPLRVRVDVHPCPR